MRRLLVPALLVGVLVGVASCSDDEQPDTSAVQAEPGDGGGEPEVGEELEAADQTVCREDATAVSTPYDPLFPDTWTFPADTTVYDVERREGTGVIVTAISQAPFEDVLDHLNTVNTAAGFEVVDGETEADDAEAEWATEDGQVGRWAIRRSGSCAGETVIQVAVFE